MCVCSQGLAYGGLTQPTMRGFQLRKEWLLGSDDMVTGAKGRGSQTLVFQDRGLSSELGWPHGEFMLRSQVGVVLLTCLSPQAKLFLKRIPGGEI